MKNDIEGNGEVHQWAKEKNSVVQRSDARIFRESRVPWNTVAFPKTAFRGVPLSFDPAILKNSPCTHALLHTGIHIFHITRARKF